MADPVTNKSQVHDFWQAQSCGEVYAVGDELRDRLRAQAAARYELEPYLKPFAKFDDGHDKDVLEVGVGMGADHLEWAKHHPKSLTGIDLTQRAVDFTSQRLRLEGFEPNVRQGDAESLPFADNSFDIVYSWGVLHHSPNTQKGIDEVHRVLRPGGTARVLIYHRRGMVAYMLWFRYSLMRRRWLSLTEIYDRYNESPGTKAYTVKEAQKLFSAFKDVKLKVQLSHGDLLMGQVGQRHKGPLLSVAQAIWPRWAIRTFLRGHGSALLIEATK